MDLNALRYATPANWQDFEALCCDLWRELWGDPAAQLNGRPGQKQDGVDIFGRPGGGSEWAGVQCKLRDPLTGGQLTREEIEEEVANARRFDQGRLTSLVIATTAPRDKNVQAIAREITRGQESAGSFPVTVSSWPDLCEQLAAYPHLVKKHLDSLWRADGPQPFHLPFRPLGDLLKGREAELAELEKGLSETATGTFAVVQQRLEAVHGLGGVGKTALAVEHGWRCGDRYSGVFFVRAETPELLQAGLAELAPMLGMAKVQEEAVVVAEVLRWLAANPGWLLILDNVDDEAAASAVTALLPKLVAGRVLITSRLSNWSGDVKEVSLDSLDENPAAAFLQERASKRVPADDDSEQAKALAQELGGLPLALEQAAAYINVNRQRFAEYRGMLGESSLEVMEWYDARLMRYPRSVADTWQPSFARLGPSARAMLHLSAFLAPEKIPRSFFEGEKAKEILAAAARADGKREEPEGFELPAAIRELAGYSFLQVTPEGFNVHRMVQEVVRSRLALEERKRWVSWCVDLANDDPGDPTDARSWPGWVSLRPHAERVIQHAVREELAEPGFATLMNNTALYLAARALYSEAEPLHRSALAIAESSYGPDHPEVAIDLNNLAQLLQATNRDVDAEPLMRRALALAESSYGPDHPTVAIRLNNLAQLLQDTNRLSEAEPLIRRALAIDESSYGQDHPTVARDLNNLAQLLQATNRLGEAEPLIRRALAIAESSYGPDHPDVARGLNNLAQLLQATNRLGEAEPLIRRALAIAESSYGPDHPTVAIELNNLAQLLQATNRLVEAEPLMRRALAIDESSYGPDHPTVAIELNNLAQLLQATNRLVEAEPLMRRALAIDKSSYGPDHPRVAIRLNNLASLLLAANRLVEAEPLMRRALTIDESSYGQDHPDVARALNNLAQLLQATNRLGEAEPLMRRAVAIDESSYGQGHPAVARDLNNLARLIQDSDRLEEAIPLMERAVKICEASLVEGHPWTETMRGNLAAMLKARDEAATR